MIDTLVKVTEKLAELLKYRSERHRRSFAELVEPIYAEMVRVHQDYLNLLGSTLSALEERRDLRQVAAELTEARRKQEATRRAASDMANELATMEVLKEYQVFFLAVGDYFLQAPLVGSTTPSTWLLFMLRQLAGRKVETLVEVDMPTEEDFVRAVESLRECLQECWSSIVKTYTTLKAASLA